MKIAELKRLPASQNAPTDAHHDGAGRTVADERAALAASSAGCYVGGGAARR